MPSIIFIYFSVHTCVRNVPDLKRHSTHNIWNRLCFKPKKKIVKRQFLEKSEKELDMVVHAFHSSSQEVEAGGSP